MKKESSTFGLDISVIATSLGVYSFSLTMDAYISGDVIVFLLYGTNTNVYPFVISAAIVDGYRDYVFSVFPTTSSNDAGMKLIDALTRTIIHPSNYVATQAVKTDNPPIAVVGAIRG